MVLACILAVLAYVCGQLYDAIVTVREKGASELTSYVTSLQQATAVGMCLSALACKGWTRQAILCRSYTDHPGRSEEAAGYKPHRPTGEAEDGSECLQVSGKQMHVCDGACCQLPVQSVASPAHAGTGHLQLVAVPLLVSHAVVAGQTRHGPLAGKGLGGCPQRGNE